MATDTEKAAAERSTANRDSSPPEVPSSEASLGSKFVVRVLLIGRPDAAGRLHSSAAATQAILTRDGHAVTTATPDEWRLSVRDPLPEVILLDASGFGAGATGAEVHSEPDYRALAALCRQVREVENVRHVPVAMLSNLEAHDESQLLSDGVSWADLRAAGVDDILTPQLSHLEVEARIALLAHYGRIRRDLGLARDQLNRHTQFDEVTQLMNRRFFFQAAHRETSRARRYHHTLACLMVDVDYFDRITKNYGYACGDYVLRAISYIVRQWTRESDIVGRFGETKIAVLLPETVVEGASVVRDKIQRAVLEGQFEWNNEKLPVSVSIGEAERRWDWQESDDDPRDLANAAAKNQAFASAEEQAATRDAAERNEIEKGSEEAESEALSVREELAELLADADAALNIAKKAALCPAVFVEYAPEPAPPSKTS